jgi:hypothetical protein
MAHGIPLKQLRSEQRRKRAAAAAGLAKGAVAPSKAVPIPSASPRPPAHYPLKRVALGPRQALVAVASLGRGDK